MGKSRFISLNDIKPVPTPKHGGFKNLEGKVFGRQKVLSFAGKDTSGLHVWFCQCLDCNQYKTILLTHLSTIKRLNRHGCMCGKHQKSLKEMYGVSYKSPEYNAWAGMKANCYSQNSVGYKNIGGRGIKVCPEWLNDFSQFYKDMGVKPSPSHVINRVDQDGNYSASNCKWATRKEFANNTSNCHVIEAFGRTQTVTQWAEEIGIKPVTLFGRIRRGWSAEEALTPTLRRNPRSNR